MRESWKVIENHPGYEISSMARVRNRSTGKLLSPYDDCSGYFRVKLDGDNCRLHILVATAHVPNPDPDNKNIFLNFENTQMKMLDVGKFFRNCDDGIAANRTGITKEVNEG